MCPRWIQTAVLVGAALAAAFTEADGAERTLRLSLRGDTIEGMPIDWNAQRVILLGRDGRYWRFPPEEAENYAIVSNRFTSYSAAEVRGMLLREFGSGFDCSGTGRYLVVHPRGQRDRWAERFEELYRSFVHYFTARGLALSPPAFPLVAVVFPRQEDFVRYAGSRGIRLGPNVLGYYCIESNRILLFDVTAGRPDHPHWYLNAETIVHEATHQVAFNTGVHRRLSDPPLWLVEGLATVFEAPGVWNPRAAIHPADRLNQGRLAAFRRRVGQGRPAGTVAALIRSDALFRSQPEIAYAESWALTYYLIESRPRQFAEYVGVIAALPVGRAYPAEQRTADFLRVFGRDLALLEADFLRQMARLH